MLHSSSNVHQRENQKADLHICHNIPLVNLVMVRLQPADGDYNLLLCAITATHHTVHTTEEASTDSKATPAEFSRCVFGRNRKVSSDHFHTPGLYTLASLARKGFRIENKAERHVRKPIHVAEKNGPLETPDQAQEISLLAIWQSLV